MHVCATSREERVKRNWEGESDQIQTNKGGRAQRELQHNEVMVLFKSTANPPTEAGRSTLDRAEEAGQEEKTKTEAGFQ